MLHRVIYASKSVGATGLSTLSIAQILGVSEGNNRRDHLTGCLLIHQGHFLQALEGARVDLDRLLRRLVADPRHTGLKVLVDTPIAERRLHDPMCLCGDPATLLERIGRPCISLVTANDVNVLLDLRTAA